MKVTLISVHGSESHIAAAARVSHSAKRPKRDDVSLIRFLVENGHLSPLEMATMTFEIEAPIFVARQILRHRTASVSEVSGRHNSSYFKKFYLPLRFRHQSKVNKQVSEGKFDNDELVEEIKKMYSLAYETYERLLSEGVARELARIVLPLATYTKFVWMMDLRNLMHFLRERLSVHSQHETRYVARQIYEHAARHFPTVVEFSINKEIIASGEGEITEKDFVILDMEKED